MMASGGRETILSSDDESLQPVQKRRRKPKPLASSDSDDDSDIEIRPRKNIKPLDCESEDSDDNFKRDAAYTSEQRFCSNTEDDFSALNDNSDNEQSEKCAICLSKFSGQDIATPETCDHMFCLECLQEWAKNVNTCPIDRLKFNLILIRHHKEDKIFKRIFVNCPELPWLYESDSESNIQTEISSCGFCGEHDNEDALLPCRECHKTFHIDCLIPPPIQLSSSSRICPCCGGCIRIKRLKSRRLDLHDTNSLSSTLGLAHSDELAQHSTNRGLWRLRQKTHELIQRYKRRRVITSSESSDEEIDPSNISSVRYYQNQISSKSLCPFIQKRRREICRSHNRAVISSAATTASNSELYSFDSDDGINETRYENYDRLVVHPSSTSRTLPSSQRRDKMISPESTPNNFDLVGSILQSQTLLHRSDVLTLKRDGSLLLNSDANSPLNSPLSSPLNSPSATSSSISIEKNEENSSNPFLKSSVFDNKSVLPYPGGAVYNQRPMNPSQNTNSKYRETPRENYSCSSSTTSIDPSVDYDNGTILARNTLDSSGNEKYNNDNSCSSVIHKSFCGSTPADDIKKVSSNYKESNKGHHSEDEVDIYSDIESVGDDEGVCNTVDDGSDRIEPMKMPYKEDESPSSNPGAASDSSDNELVIDEDMAADEETENRKDIFQVTNSNNKNDRTESAQVNESDDSNASFAEPFSHEQTDNGTPDVQDENCSYIDSRSVDDIHLGEESSQGTFQDNTGPESYKNESECDENKNESDDDEDKNESDIEDKNGSFGESKNESEDEDKNESELDDKNESELDDKNESEVEIEAEDKNHSECDDQESDMDVQVYEENSIDSPKKSPRAETSTPCSTISSKQYDEDMKQESLEDHCDNSISSENQEYCDTIDNDAEIGKNRENNESTNDSISQAEENENYQNETNSNLSFESVQLVSESDEVMDSNIDASIKFSEEDKKELHEIGSDVDMKSDNPEEEGESVVNSDNVDISENASTPCLDEHIDGQIENSPVHDTLENSEQYSKLEHVETRDFDQKSDRSLSTGEYESCENDKNNEHFSEEPLECNTEKVPDNSVDLGIEDISEAGSGDLDDDFGEENMSFSENKKQMYNDDERDDMSNFEANDGIDPDSKISSKVLSENVQYHSSPQISNQSYDDREEGEIIEEKPLSRKDRKRSSKYDCFLDEKDDYAPRVNICDLPRIPKIKRDRERDSIPHELPIETKRTSVLGRVDLGGGDISWKRLSKHNRERSYRDGRPKDERVLYRERESRKKDKKYNDNEWRSDSKSSRRDDSKKQDSEKYRNDYESRSRKNDKKDKVSDWSYSDRDKRNKSHKEKHKDKHKDKKDKIKHEKNKYSKDESKYNKIKDEDHYDREIRFDKEQRYERIVYEKGRFKEKDHKSKHKDRKSDGKSSKDHSREKHKHVHTNDHFSDKQREREVRKIDDKIKVVVEQKDTRKEKAKHKEKKDSKHDKKQVHHHEHRKKEIERSPYTELSSIESKEIFAKGDSIIINVNFNRTSSPKDVIIENADSNFKDKKNIDDFELEEIVNNEKSKGKHSLNDKGKSLEASISKRPTTPPERTNQVLSVSESYWQGGDDSDANNSPTSDKSVEEAPVVEEENETMESADDFEVDNLSNSCNSVEVPESQPAVKEGVSICEETSEKPEKVDSSFSKEIESIVPSKRRSPRSPSPPSPADNDSYDPCEPTRSPSPPPVPPAPPLPLGNPKPPPSPELPPLPPEPEPIDNIREETTHKQSTSSDFIAVSSVVASSSSQSTNVISQVSVANSISLPSILLPPPSFLSHTPATTNSLPTLSSLLPPRNFNFQVNNHPNVIFTPNHVQQVIQGIVPTQLHAGTTIPPPPNPPSLPHMGSVPPPPPPPSAMALISQVRHPQINVQPALSANSLLQNLTLGHPVTLPQMQMSHLHHLPPNLSNALSQPMLIPSQNQSVSLPVSIQNQSVSRVVLPQNQMLNHTVALQNQNNINSKPQNNITSHLPLTNSTPQKPDKQSTAEKQEVVDMEVDSPYSPGDSPSMDSVCDYSPTCSPLPSTPKSKDIFDSLLPSDHRTTDRKTQETPSKAEKSKRSDLRSDIPSKKSKHEHKSDSGKVRHSVRMQIADKGKTRKEQKTEKKLDDSQLKILDELPSSAVEMQVKEKFLKKLNRQERVVEEVKLALKPYYKSRDVTKEEYKDILRKSVPKICHNRSGEINPLKVKTLVECYIKKIKHSRKKSDKKKSSKLS